MKSKKYEVGKMDNDLIVTELSRLIKNINEPHWLVFLTEEKIKAQNGK